MEGGLGQGGAVGVVGVGGDGLDERGQKVELVGRRHDVDGAEVADAGESLRDRVGDAVGDGQQGVM